MNNFERCKAFIHKSLAPILLFGGISACTGPHQADKAHTPAQQHDIIQEMYNEYRNDFPDIQEVWPADITEAYQSDELILIDVRSPQEQAISMIPRAITQQEFEKNQSDYEGKRIIVHCTIGYRSGVYVKELATQGINAENLAGSILSWAHQGLPLENPNGQPTKDVHVYGKKWDLLPEGYKAIW